MIYSTTASSSIFTDSTIPTRDNVMFLALLLPHHYQSINPKHKNPNQHSNTHALDQFTSSRQFTATPIQPPSSTKKFHAPNLKTLANQPHAIPPLPMRKQTRGSSPRIGTPIHVLSIPPHKYTQSVLENNRDLRYPGKWTLKLHSFGMVIHRPFELLQTSQFGGPVSGLPVVRSVQ